MNKNSIVKKVLGIHGMKSCIEKDSRKERIKKFYESGIELKLFQFNKEEDPTYESWKETFEKNRFFRIGCSLY